MMKSGRPGLVLTLLFLLTGCSVSADREVKSEYPGYVTVILSRIHAQDGGELMLCQFKWVNTAHGEQIVTLPRIMTRPGHTCTMKLQDQSKKSEENAFSWPSRSLGEVNIDAPGNMLVVNGRFTGDSTASVNFLLVSNEADGSSCFIVEREVNDIRLGEEVRIDLSGK